MHMRFGSVHTAAWILVLTSGVALSVSAQVTPQAEGYKIEIPSSDGTLESPIYFSMSGLRIESPSSVITYDQKSDQVYLISKAAKTYLLLAQVPHSAPLSQSGGPWVKLSHLGDKDFKSVHCRMVKVSSYGAASEWCLAQPQDIGLSSKEMAAFELFNDKFTQVSQLGLLGGTFPKDLFPYYRVGPLGQPVLTQITRMRLDSNLFLPPPDYQPDRR